MPTTTPAITAIYRLPSDSVLAQIRADIGSTNLLPALSCDAAILVLTTCDVDQHSMTLLFGLSHGVGRLARWDWLQRIMAKSINDSDAPTLLYFDDGDEKPEVSSRLGRGAATHHCSETHARVRSRLLAGDTTTQIVATLHVTNSLVKRVKQKILDEAIADHGGDTAAAVASLEPLTFDRSSKSVACLYPLAERKNQ